MAIEKVKRVEVVGLAKDREQTLDYLHQLGVMHLSSQESTQNKHNLSRASSVDKLSSVAQTLLTLKRFEEILLPFAIKPKIHTKHLTYDQAVQEVLKMKKELYMIENLSEERMHLLEEIDSLNKKRIILEDLPFDITKEMLSTTFSKLLLFHGEYPQLPGTKVIEFEYTLVQCGVEVYEKHKKEFTALQPIDLSVIEESISADGRKDRKQFAEDNAALEKIESELRSLASRFTGEVLRLTEQFNVYRERYEKTSYMLATKDTFVLQGYLPTSAIKRLNPPVALHISEIACEEDVPVKLKHLPYVRHFGFITRMFGLPQYASIDPTIYLSLFIPLFFGFMFSDIGYGILVLLVAGALLFKGDAKTPVIRDAGVVLGVCGMSTVLFGALFGSFFGNLFGITPLLFDPFANAQMILISSLAIGLVHINLGLLLAIKKNTIGVLSFWFLQAGAAMLFLGVGMFSWLVLGISFALFVYKSKLMGLMEITGFVGTWFSYARLLALALATGGIALGINIIGNLAGNVPYIGTGLLIFVLIVGHAFNFALNILGSSIHSVRLHYIEFFSQFYEAGGKPFVAFTTKKIQEEL